jgi:SAM-dependent methyltransferase
MAPFDFAAAYDDLNTSDRDYRFYAALADRIDARHILDLGCGTGRFARLVARRERQVIAIDPDPRMLEVARRDPGPHPIEWRLGDSGAAPTSWADLAVMSGHVAQVFLDDEAWDTTLSDLHRALRPGGVLAFESRNPDACGWAGWNRRDTLRMVGGTEFWHEVAEVDLPLVAYDTVTRDVRTDEQTTHRDTLAFRTESELRKSLHRNGFAVEQVYGDWGGEPLGPTTPEIIVVARCAAG